jgi:hypothetical protein
VIGLIVSVQRNHEDGSRRVREALLLTMKDGHYVFTNLI